MMLKALSILCVVVALLVPPPPYQVYLPMVTGGENSMTFPTMPILDDFNRANEGPPPSANWTTLDGSPVVDANKAANTDGIDPGSAYWNVTQPGPDCEVYATFTTRQTDTGVNAIFARYDLVGGNGYILQIYRQDGPGDTAILVTGTNPNVITIPITLLDGDAYGMELIGSTINIYQKPAAGAWTLIGTVVDTEVSGAGYVGFSLSDTTARMDDFGGGDYTPPYTTVGYSIITPDGVTTDLLANGLNVNPGIPDGFGLPTVTHRTSNLYRNAGALLKGIDVEPRIVTITASAIAGSQEALHAVRARLWAALRWNRTLTDPPQAARLRYTANGHTADLYIHYLSDVIGNAGGAINLQQIGIRVIAYDPLWYATTETAGALDVPDTLGVSFIVGKINDAWDNMGNSGVSYVRDIAVSEDGDRVYVAGTFQNWAGIANADRIVMYTLSTATWSALGTGADGAVYALAIDASGNLYAGGSFANIGGVAAARIAMWNGSAWSALGVGVDGVVYDLAFGETGILYVGGAFTNAGGGAANRIAAWDGTAWSALGTGMDVIVYAVVVGKDGTVFAGGAFTTADGGAALRMASWNGTVWSAMGAGMDDSVYVLIVADDGTLYAGGIFLTAGAISALRIARWNGIAWSALGSGLNGPVYYNALAIDAGGDLYVGGGFTVAGGLTLTDRLAVWNGTAWSQIDIDLPAAPDVQAIRIKDSDLFIGFIQTGTATISHPTTITTAGDYETFPVFTITGPGTLQHVINETSGEQLIFNLYVNPGEVLTIDLAPGVKTIESSWPARPSAMAGLSLPQSDLGIWSLKPDPAAASGDNSVSLLMTGTTPADYNDDQGPAGAAQLDDWEDITGETYLNTDAQGAMYVNVVNDGGGFFHVDLYSDAAKAAGDLVGHTATYNGAGAQAIVADNASGLGGTITIVSATAADANIVVYFATAKVEFYDRYMSADEACQ